MARLPRCSAAGFTHLVELRWSGDLISRMDAAMRAVLHRLLADALPRHGADLHAYALGRSRAVLLLTPKSDGSLARLVQDVSRRLAVHVRRAGGPAGPLLAGRFRSAILQPEVHLLDAMQFVEQLALREGHAAIASEWTSARAHCDGAADPMVTDHAGYWLTGNTPFEREARYRQRLAEPLAPQTQRRFERALNGGWPVGDEAFLQTLSPRLARPVVPRRPGRPRSEAK